MNVHRRHEHSVTHAFDAGQHVAEISRIHAFAQEAFAVTRKRRDDQGRYLAEISEQLGLASGRTGKARSVATPRRSA